MFYHRTLRCLVAMELKTGKFKPEYVSKMDFYLEGLDRQVKKTDENPSVGLILCASKNDEVVNKGYAKKLTEIMIEQAKLKGKSFVIECSPEQLVTRHIAEFFKF